jgi:regulatory protein YycI of two-component signal transduction system YycFG
MISEKSKTIFIPIFISVKLLILLILLTDKDNNYADLVNETFETVIHFRSGTQAYDEI